MRTLLVLCGIAALIGAGLAFKSRKYEKPIQHVTAPWIVNGTFRTRVDHFRAQDARTVDFVRKFFLFVIYACVNHGINDLHSSITPI